VNRRLRVDPIGCKAHGLCAELFPERIRLDDWGYPIIDGSAIPTELLDHARRAVSECPRQALHLTELHETGERQPPAPPPADRRLAGPPQPPGR
jgi:ferredoxin